MVRGRKPFKNKEKIRVKAVSFRCTRKQREELKIKSKEEGVTISEYLYQWALKSAIITACLLSMISIAQAKDIIQGPIKIDVIRVYDGDTITQAIAHVWPGVRIQTSIRIIGIDTPEIRGKCEAEKKSAVEAKAVAIRFLTVGNVFLKNVQLGKYAGRVLGDVINQDGESLKDALIAAKLARPYSGGKRQGWCK